MSNPLCSTPVEMDGLEKPFRKLSFQLGQYLFPNVSNFLPSL